MRWPSVVAGVRCWGESTRRWLPCFYGSPSGFPSSAWAAAWKSVFGVWFRISWQPKYRTVLAFGPRLEGANIDQLQLQSCQVYLGPDGVFGDGIKSPAKQWDAAFKTGCLNSKLGGGQCYINLPAIAGRHSSYWWPPFAAVTAWTSRLINSETGPHMLDSLPPGGERPIMDSPGSC